MYLVVISCLSSMTSTMGGFNWHDIVIPAFLFHRRSLFINVSYILFSLLIDFTFLVTVLIWNTFWLTTWWNIEKFWLSCKCFNFILIFSISSINVFWTDFYSVPYKTYGLSIKLPQRGFSGQINKCSTHSSNITVTPKVSTSFCELTAAGRQWLPQGLEKAGCELLG